MIALLAALVWADPPTGEELKPDLQGLAMRVEPIGDGVVRNGRWTALDATLVNTGPGGSGTLSTSEQVDLDLHTMGFSREIELAKASKKRLLLPVAPGLGGDHQVALDLGIRGGLDRRVAYRIAQDADVTIGVIGTDALGIQALGRTWGGPVPGMVPRAAGDTRNIAVGLLDPAALPDRSLLYGSYDWVVWPKPQAGQLDAARVDALLGWVADGGHLFVTVSDDAAAVAASPLAEALPVALSGVADRSLAPLGLFLRQPVPDGPAPVAVGTPRSVPGRDAWIWAETAGQPLLSAWSYGLGTVHVLLADPTVEPLAHGVDRLDLWRRLLFLPPPDAGSQWYQPDLPMDYSDTLSALDAWPEASRSSALQPIDPVLADRLHLGASSYASGSVLQPYSTGNPVEELLRPSLSEIPGVAPLPTGVLMLFSVVYLLVIGPFDWFVLKALRREPWTWVTYPIYIAIFSGLALVATSLHKGGQAASVRIELVDALPGSPYWRGDDYLGIFAIQRTQVRVQAGFEGGMVTPLATAGSMWEPSIEAGDGPGALSWRAETWTLAYARSRWVTKAPGSITVSRDGDGWVVRNDTDHELLDSTLVWGDQSFVLGPVAARGTARASVDEARSAGNALDPSDVDLRQSPTPRALLGWATSAFGNRATVDRGLLDSQWARPSLVALSADPIEPLAVEGLSLRENRVSLLRIPVEPAILQGLPAPKAPEFGTGRVLTGTKVQIIELGRNDWNYANRDTYLGKPCWVQYDADADPSRYYKNINLLCDGTTYPLGFSEVRLKVLEAPRATPYLDAGKQVRVAEYGPDETADRRYLGQTCTVTYAYGSASFYSGEMTCGGTNVVFTRAWLEDLSATSLFDAAWSDLGLTGDQTAIRSIGESDLELEYPSSILANGLFSQHLARLEQLGWTVVTRDDATNTASIERNGAHVSLVVTATSDGVLVHYTRP